LPVGGTADDTSAINQCVPASWLGPDIPDGVSVAVTGWRIEPKGLFSRSGSGCGGPSCRPSFAFTADRETCTVAITATGPAGASATLFVDGYARCSADQRAWCRDLAGAPRQSIPLIVPGEPEPDPDDGGTEQDGDGTEPDGGGTDASAEAAAEASTG
jgi:hypothetical protein